jgi:hypothetical protein
VLQRRRHLRGGRLLVFALDAVALDAVARLDDRLLGGGLHLVGRVLVGLDDRLHLLADREPQPGGDDAGRDLDVDRGVAGRVRDGAVETRGGHHAVTGRQAALQVLLRGLLLLLLARAHDQRHREDEHEQQGQQ